MTPTTFRVRRLGSWLPAGVFFTLLALALLGAPKLSEKLPLVPLTLVSAIWLVRCRRVLVQTTEEEVMVRTATWTHRYRWNDVVEAKLVRMPTASPFAARLPYVALGLRLRDGRLRTFEDISAAAARQSSISVIVEHINEHCGAK
jgi:hypothetical protein